MPNKMWVFLLICVVIIIFYVNKLKSNGIFNTLGFINFVSVKDGKEINIKKVTFSSDIGLTKINIAPLMTRLNNTYIIEGDYDRKKYKNVKHKELCFSKPEDIVQNILETFFDTKLRNVVLHY